MRSAARSFAPATAIRAFGAGVAPSRVEVEGLTAAPGFTGSGRLAGTSAGPQSGSLPPAMTTFAVCVAPSVVQPPEKSGTLTSLTPSASANTSRVPSGDHEGMP